MMDRCADSGRRDAGPLVGDAGFCPERVLPARAEGIAEAARVIMQDAGVVGYPTETQYGLAVNPFDPLAVQRLVCVKGRHDGHPFALIAANREMVEDVVGPLSRAALGLADRFWPGPLTLLLPCRVSFPDGLLNDRGEIGIRISSDPVAQRLACAVGGPVTATSANFSGQPAATRAVAASLKGVAVVLDDGPRAAKASTVARCERGEVVVLRQGAIAV